MLDLAVDHQTEDAIIEAIGAIPAMLPVDNG
jgi:hypothetical protein